jgi:hypothetical protein
MKQTYQSPQVVPDLGDVRVQAYRSGICIKCISVLINLVVQNANRAPKCRVPSVSIDGLLIRLVRLWILLLRHVTPTEQIPALRITLICHVLARAMWDCTLFDGSHQS